MSGLICPDCREPRPDRGVPCSVCGSTDDTQVIEIGMVVEMDSAQPIGMKAISGGVDEPSFRVQRQTFSGTHSDARLQNGLVTLNVSSPSDAGRPGESAALALLIEVMSDRGFSPKELAAADDRGEDAMIEISGQRYTVQMISVPPDSGFWQAAAHGCVNSRVGIGEASEWIRTCIETKANRTPEVERKRTMLVLDAHHAGVLSSFHIESVYLSRYPTPLDEFGFAATWLLGPDSDCVLQLGAASWDVAACQVTVARNSNDRSS